MKALVFINGDKVISGTKTENLYFYMIQGRVL
jgi:hypothetical protein